MSQENSESEQAFQNIYGSIIDGVHTDIVYHPFENKVFLLITQYEKIANIILVQKHKIFEQNNKKTLTIQHKFGTDSEEITATVKFLMENTGLSEVEKDVMFSLGLKKINKKVVNELAEALKCIKFQ